MFTACFVGVLPKNQELDLQQRLAHESNTGRTLCHKTGGCALRVTDLRRAHIRKACIAECDSNKNRTSAQPAAAAAGTAAIAPARAQLVEGVRVVGATEAAALVAAGIAVAGIATVATAETEGVG